MPTRESSDAERRRQFDADNLTKTVITEPLLSRIRGDREKGEDSPHRVIIDLNLDYPKGTAAARARVRELVRDVAGEGALFGGTSEPSHPYIFAELTGEQIQELVRRSGWFAPPPLGAPQAARVFVDNASANEAPLASPIFRIWEDTQVHALVTRSLATVKADAAQVAFAARGAQVVWAVVDSGIDGDHPHFARYKNLVLPEKLQHRDFTVPDNKPERPLVDDFGHGTHVAGIIAGAMSDQPLPDGTVSRQPVAATKMLDEAGRPKTESYRLSLITGMAPEARLVSLKVLNAQGVGNTSDIIEAIEAIQRFNDYGRRLLVHGVNMSVGYQFDPEWFACGQSPLCVEVNRLVRSGVVVVVAAGNSGYGFVQAKSGGQVAAGLPLTINDPGNAELAITVGSTHRDMPHTYGVSYFSAKGPTGDGRRKPDLVAPGERILSCAAGSKKTVLLAQLRARDPAADFDYLEDSGTSMAAPHVSGVIAAFLSIRQEYKGEPEKVKRIFLDSATDLGRDCNFQGKGLVDLMRAIQSI